MNLWSEGLRIQGLPASLTEDLVLYHSPVESPEDRRNHVARKNASSLTLGHTYLIVTNLDDY